jgi:hypothetical protein
MLIVCLCVAIIPLSVWADEEVTNVAQEGQTVDDEMAGDFDEDAIAPDAGSSAQDLAAAAQNPVADMISLPFQNNTTFNVGYRDKTANVLNIQPVIPFNLSEDWNLISRTIIPLLYVPEVAPGVGDEFGLSDIQQFLFFSPSKPRKLIWGAGPIFQFPTATDDILGSEKWAAGPAVVALRADAPWVYGALANHLWSFAGDDDREDVNKTTIQPFLNYNFPSGLYLSSSPLITADWERDDDKWVVPLGGGIGKIIRIGKLPVNISAQAYYNVEAPDSAGDWSTRVQLTFLFPK